nr:MAG TPA: hypothetical protein [Caudoviricetes sp.]
MSFPMRIGEGEAPTRQPQQRVGCVASHQPMVQAVDGDVE